MEETLEFEISTVVKIILQSSTLKMKEADNDIQDYTTLQSRGK
jgi:hypothetical protein